MDEDSTLPPKAAVDTRTPMEKLYDHTVRGIADAHGEAVQKQVLEAFTDAPAGPDDVDAWFEKHFHKPPVSHDTTLFNQLQAIRAAVRDAAGRGAG